MRAGFYYLNNTGHKWVVFGADGRREKITLKTKSGKTIERRVNHYTALGNFATANISYKGKRINVFADSELDD